MYYLKLYDDDLLSFDMENDLGLKISNIKILSNNKNVFPICLKDVVNEEKIEEFIN